MEKLFIKEEFMKDVSLILLVACMFLSCQSPAEKAKSKEKFDWNAGISAPKNYPAAPFVEYFYKGKSIGGTSTGIGDDQGWGITMGGNVGGDQFKLVPDSVFVKWRCAFDLIQYEGGFKLPRQKMLMLFKKGVLENKKNREEYSLIIAGTAPGGNITIWMQGDRTLTEIEKFKAKKVGQADRLDPNSVTLWTSKGEEAKEILTYIYLHGVPYSVWEKGEKEYNYDIGFTTEEEDKKDYSIAISGYTKDGSVIYSNEDPIPYTKWNENVKLKVTKSKKLPVEFYIQWISQDDQEWYEAQIVLPNDLESRFIEFQKKHGNNVFLTVGMDKVLENKPYTFGRIWLENFKEKIELMKFRAAKLDVSKTRKLKYQVSKYSLPKGFVFPKWEGREPLTKPTDFEYWKEI